jgi:hypothetical protein
MVPWMSAQPLPIVGGKKFLCRYMWFVMMRKGVCSTRIIVFQCSTARIAALLECFFEFVAHTPEGSDLAPLKCDVWILLADTLVQERTKNLVFKIQFFHFFFKHSDGLAAAKQIQEKFKH